MGARRDESTAAEPDRALAPGGRGFEQHGFVLRQLADAEEPLLNSLSDVQKRRFFFFARLERRFDLGRLPDGFAGPSGPDEEGRGPRDRIVGWPAGATAIAPIATTGAAQLRRAARLAGDGLARPPLDSTTREGATVGRTGAVLGRPTGWMVTTPTTSTARTISACSGQALPLRPEHALVKTTLEPYPIQLRIWLR